MIILGLGTNIGDRLYNLRQALNHLRSSQKLTNIRVSPVYESDALLPDNAHDTWDAPYLNAAISCQTKLSPIQLLQLLKNIETIMGRDQNHPRWSPRLIDIDILAWDNKIIQNENLTIPHKRLYERPFALWPLTDLLPNWRYCLPEKNYHNKPVTEIVKLWGSRFDGNAPLHTRQISHRIDTPQLVGILNITPDSFSDGGNYIKIENAVSQAQHLFNSGAEIIDIGAESTRPNVTNKLFPIAEWNRLQPVLQALNNHWSNASFKPKISVDTRNTATAAKAISFGVDWINDVTGCDNPDMCQLIVNTKVKIVFMHHLGVPPKKNIVLNNNKNATTQVYQWAKQRLEQLLQIGIQKERLIFDPGIGFGKSAEQSLALIKNAAKLHKLGIPLLIGHSRKSFLNQFTNKDFHERDIETAIFSNCLHQQNISYLRVHNVELNMRALKIASVLS
jgi:2-amino-4-hydroxy-6-hydroxymethyldihydropteridine diphosphokinase/dihydropteroate synthase